MNSFEFNYSTLLLIKRLLTVNSCFNGRSKNYFKNK